MQADGLMEVRTWLIHSQQQPAPNSHDSQNTQRSLRFCFLFGTKPSQKNEQLNLIKKNSLLFNFLREYRKPIEKLCISIFFQD